MRAHRNWTQEEASIENGRFPSEAPIVNAQTLLKPTNDQKLETDFILLCVSSSECVTFTIIVA